GPGAPVCRLSPYTTLFRSRVGGGGEGHGDRLGAVCQSTRRDGDGAVVGADGGDHGGEHVATQGGGSEGARLTAAQPIAAAGSCYDRKRTRLNSSDLDI